MTPARVAGQGGSRGAWWAKWLPTSRLQLTTAIPSAAAWTQCGAPAPVPETYMTIATMTATAQAGRHNPTRFWRRHAAFPAARQPFVALARCSTVLGVEYASVDVLQDDGIRQVMATLDQPTTSTVTSVKGECSRAARRYLHGNVEAGERTPVVNGLPARAD